MNARKPVALVTVFLLVLTIMLQGIKPVLDSYADEVDVSSYTAVVKYYDDVQLTYRLIYPSSGIWSGAGDVPIGGMQISDQIYCADPFVAFHSMADSSSWSNTYHATVDSKEGYVVAAPWAVSSPMRQNNNAVTWMVLNGYRGDYLAHDQVSQASVKRLNEMYPDIGVIDKRVALMATKFAIWKILAGDSVTILGTSLDRTASRETFNALVDKLVADALNNTPTPLKSTSLSIEIDAHGAHDSTEGAFVYYGPLTINAMLENPSGQVPYVKLDTVFLTTSGPELDNVEFVAADKTPCDSDILYGTDETAQCIDGGMLYPAGDEWVWKSTEFYVKLPQSRLGAEPSSDLLSLRAVSVLKDVPLLEGTPMTFVYQRADGVQDWNAVQAFVGAAKDGMYENLYAQAFLSTGETELGELYVMKEITNATPLDANTEFTFQLYQATSDDIASATLVDLNDHPVHNAANVDTTTNSFTLKNGGMALIDNLPVINESSALEYYYWLEETNLPSNYETPEFSISIARSTVAQSPGTMTSAFQLDDGVALAMVTFHNTRSSDDYHRGYLSVGKAVVTVPPETGIPDYGSTEPFRFLLEYSDDDGEAWSPVDLGGVFESDGGVIDANETGVFIMRSLDQAFVEIDVDKLYRVSELTVDSTYLAMYAVIFYWEEDGIWQSRQQASTSDPLWQADNDQNYTVGGLSLQEDEYALLVFTNLDIDLVDLTLQKTVKGTSEAYDPDALYAFEVLYMTAGTILAPYQAVPLTDDPTIEAAFLVEGIDAGRIGEDEFGNNVILYLKDGETAVIHNLPAGYYLVYEHPDPAYTSTYQIDSGEKTATLGGASETFMMTGDTVVLLENTLAGVIIPRTGDQLGIFCLAIAVLLFGSALIAIVRWRRNKEFNAYMSIADRY